MLQASALGGSQRGAVTRMENLHLFDINIVNCFKLSALNQGKKKRNSRGATHL